ncbi:MAG TPA: hypothetical protein VK900_15035 [Anaerolineales bacterium]|nr:hypothetical protein [Anaerolineales bacterium]
MVHALEETRRVLVPEGVLIDIRPIAERWPIEVVSTRGINETGRVNDLPEQVNADVASNKAMADVEARGWFRREQEELFPFFYSWDTPSELEEFIADDWGDFIELDEETRRTTRAAWASADADSRVRVRMKVSITRWKKITDASQC